MTEWNREIGKWNSHLERNREDMVKGEAFRSPTWPCIALVEEYLRLDQMHSFFFKSLLTQFNSLLFSIYFRCSYLIWSFTTFDWWFVQPQRNSLKLSIYEAHLWWCVMFFFGLNRMSTFIGCQMELNNLLKIEQLLGDRWRLTGEKNQELFISLSYI